MGFVHLCTMGCLTACAPDTSPENRVCNITIFLNHLWLQINRCRFKLNSLTKVITVMNSGATLA
jgi:hypothetical protein